MFPKNLAFPVSFRQSPLTAVDRNPATAVMNDLPCLEPKEQINIYSKEHSPGQSVNFAMSYFLITIYWKLILSSPNH